MQYAGGAQVFLRNVQQSVIRGTIQRFVFVKGDKSRCGCVNSQFENWAFPDHLFDEVSVSEQLLRYTDIIRKGHLRPSHCVSSRIPSSGNFDVEGGGEAKE
jgi:hypothetical protein